MIEKLSERWDKLHNITLHAEIKALEAELEQCKANILVTIDHLQETGKELRRYKRALELSVIRKGQLLTGVEYWLAEADKELIK